MDHSVLPRPSAAIERVVGSTPGRTLSTQPRQGNPICLNVSFALVGRPTVPISDLPGAGGARRSAATLGLSGIAGRTGDRDRKDWLMNEQARGILASHTTCQEAERAGVRLSDQGF